MTAYKTLDDLDAGGKTVLLRADLNVPMKDGKVSDDQRLRRLLPTLKELTGKGARIAILSHFGRPDGKRDAKYSLKPVAAALAQLLGAPVATAEDCVGENAAQAVKSLAPGAVLVLENTRFHAGEEANDNDLAKQMADLGDIYVNDAFSAAHRAHASTAALAKLRPAYAGRLMQAELDALAKALDKPERPVIAIVGGSKISTKLDLLHNLIGKVDALALGGGMANTFLAAQGVKIGLSLFELNMLDTAREIMAQAEKRGCKLILPTDAVVAAKLEANIATQTVDVHAIPGDAMMLDIGPASAKALGEELARCKTLVWNGPLGAFEFPPFEAATVAVAKEAAQLTASGKLLSVAGGGDTVAALAQAGVLESMTYVSTAGGAFLEWLEGKTLPGVAALAN